MKFTSILKFSLLCVLPFSVFGANNKALQQSSKHAHKFYVGASGAAAWSGSFDGWGVLTHVGYKCHTFDTGIGALELETGYIDQTHSRSSVGCYQRAPYKNTGATVKQSFLARADQHRKAELKMVPLMLNYVFHADLEKCLESPSGKNWIFDVGIGVGSNWIKAENKGYINWAQGNGKIFNAPLLKERKHNFSAIGQIFAHVGYRITPAVKILAGCRGLLTEKATFGSGTPTEMRSEHYHFLVDLGLEIDL